MPSTSQFENPYLTPQTFAAVPPPLPAVLDAEAIRREHLNTEASIKSLAILHYLGAAILLLSAIGMVISGFHEKGTQSFSIGTLLAGIAVFEVALAGALRKFSPWAKNAAGILAAIGVIGFPIGTIISVCILVLLMGKKGTMVFSPAYKDIIAATPHVKHRNSKSTWVALVLALLLIAAIIVYLVVYA